MTLKMTSYLYMHVHTGTHMNMHIHKERGKGTRRGKVEAEVTQQSRSLPGLTAAV